MGIRQLRLRVQQGTVQDRSRVGCLERERTCTVGSPIGFEGPNGGLFARYRLT